MALAAYRHLLRATRIAFNKDTTVLTSARKQVRNSFLSKRSLTPESPESISAIKHAEEVANFLRHNVVQGEKAEEHGANIKVKSSQGKTPVDVATDNALIELLNTGSSA
ncbi:Mitochondrial zinc maintenance protein 1, mitochondrial [Ciborinia camelliae]|nr:Mitochondrial zinc maintenance protein 1, mitochondrial [Ciborinia camelliae]